MLKEDAKNVLKLYRSSNRTIMVAETGMKEHEFRKEHEEAMRVLYGPRARGLAEDSLRERYLGK